MANILLAMFFLLSIFSRMFSVRLRMMWVGIIYGYDSMIKMATSVVHSLLAKTITMYLTISKRSRKKKETLPPNFCRNVFLMDVHYMKWLAKRCCTFQEAISVSNFTFSFYYNFHWTKTRAQPPVPQLNISFLFCGFFWSKYDHCNFGC